MKKLTNILKESQHFFCQPNERIGNYNVLSNTNRKLKLYSKSSEPLILKDDEVNDLIVGCVNDGIKEISTNWGIFEFHLDDKVDFNDIKIEGKHIYFITSNTIRISNLDLNEFTSVTFEYSKELSLKNINLDCHNLYFKGKDFPSLTKCDITKDGYITIYTTKNEKSLKVPKEFTLFNINDNMIWDNGNITYGKKLGNGMFDISLKDFKTS